MFMKDFVHFFREIGKLKRMPRRGWVINGIKNPESIAEHIFRAAVMVWVLGAQKNLDTNRAVKMLLVHDLCEVYAGDETPYDKFLPKDKKKLPALMRTWPRPSLKKKAKWAREKEEREWKGLIKLTEHLPAQLKKEMRSLWLDYQKKLTKEGRFANQVDRMENLVQALEYWKRYRKPPLLPWWWWAKEFFDDPLLIEFMDTLDTKFLGDRKKGKKRKK
jgi:putative hydrolase of HD superfamily